MKKKLNRTIIKALLCFCCLSILILNFGCKKWLEKKPDTSLSTPETLSDLQALLDNGFGINYGSTSSLSESFSDDYFVLSALLNTDSYKRQYTWQKEVTPLFSNDWRSEYIPIYPMNICLDRIKTINRTPENASMWDNVKGSALFFRAYFFTQLVWEFSKAYDESTSESDLGIVLRLGSDPSVLSERANVSQSYHQIIDDVKQAILYLPDNSIHSLRPSKTACYGLLARVFLSMRIYDSAFVYANRYLQLNNQLMDFNSDGDIVNPFTSTLNPFKRFNKETIFYTEMNQNYSIHNPYNGLVDTLLYSSYNANDLRKIAYFKQSGSYHAFKGSYLQSDILFFTGIATDEMYLIRAECYARLNNKTDALADLNTLLIKRWRSGFFTAVTAPTAEAAVDVILQERRKELLFRGLRWIDIKRLNKEGRNIIPTRLISGNLLTLPANDDRYAIYIPQDIIDITGIPQNPGW